MQCKNELFWLIALRLCGVVWITSDSKFRGVAKSCEFFGFLQLTIAGGSKVKKGNPNALILGSASELTLVRIESDLSNASLENHCQKTTCTMRSRLTYQW